MKKNINLKVLLCLAVTLCTIFVMFTACTKTGGKQTSEPSPDVYADPTEKATIVPITISPTLMPTPPAEITHDVEMLSAFFDTPSKVEGKTNGQLLFEYYESGNPYTWHLHSGKEYRKYVANGHTYDEFILWANSDGYHFDYSGYVEEIQSNFFVDENKILNFGGTLRFDGFESLRSIELCNISADELIIENCGKLEYVSMYIDLEKSNHFFEKVYINARIGSSDIYPCAREFRLVVPAPEWLRDFDITALADGDGIVSVSLDYDTHYPNVVIYAAAAEGSHFVGWYDEEGHKVTENEWYVLT